MNTCKMEQKLHEVNKFKFSMDASQRYRQYQPLQSRNAFNFLRPQVATGSAVAPLDTSVPKRSRRRRRRNRNKYSKNVSEESIEYQPTRYPVSAATYQSTRNLYDNTQRTYQFNVLGATRSNQYFNPRNAYSFNYPQVPTNNWFGGKKASVGTSITRTNGAITMSNISNLNSVIENPEKRDESRVKNSMSKSKDEYTLSTHGKNNGKGGHEISSPNIVSQTLDIIEPGIENNEGVEYLFSVDNSRTGRVLEEIDLSCENKSPTLKPSEEVIHVSEHHLSVPRKSMKMISDPDIESQTLDIIDPGIENNEGVEYLFSVDNSSTGRVLEEIDLSSANKIPTPKPSEEILNVTEHQEPRKSMKRKLDLGEEDSRKRANNNPSHIQCCLCCVNYNYLSASGGSWNIAKCGHMFCNTCTFSKERGTKCPICASNLLLLRQIYL